MSLYFRTKIWWTTLQFFCNYVTVRQSWLGSDRSCCKVKPLYLYLESDWQTFHELSYILILYTETLYFLLHGSAIAVFLEWLVPYLWAFEIVAYSRM
jgi:hypothetical protein